MYMYMYIQKRILRYIYIYIYIYTHILYMAVSHLLLYPNSVVSSSPLVQWERRINIHVDLVWEWFWFWSPENNIFSA